MWKSKIFYCMVENFEFPLCLNIQFKTNQNTNSMVFFFLGHRVPDNSGLGEAIAMTTFDHKSDDNKSEVDQDENETSLDP